MLERIKSSLQGKVMILGIGNTLRRDDGVGVVLAGRLKGKTRAEVIDAGTSPENYLGKVIKEKPDTLIIVDAADFGAAPGEFKEIAGQDLQTGNLFSTHNASISLTINYLQSNLKVDIIVLIIQPKSIVFGDQMTPELTAAIDSLEGWFRKELQCEVS